jgi:membrane protease YdiL (CAAX protease family)
MDSQKKGVAPIFALLLVYCLLWFDLFIPLPSLAPFSAAWLGLLAFEGCVRTGGLVWIGGRLAGAGLLDPDLGLPESALPRPREILNGLGIGACLSAIALVGALLAFLAGFQNPLFARYRPTASPGLIPFVLMCAACLGTGYSEELFFRFFAVGSLARAGFPRSAAYLISGLIFALAHLGQGIFGAALAGVFALVFSFFRIRGSGLHELAFGHAVYDLAVLLALSMA